MFVINERNFTAIKVAVFIFDLTNYVLTLFGFHLLHTNSKTLDAMASSLIVIFEIAVWIRIFSVVI